MTVLVKVAFFSFLSFYTVWFGYNVANKDKIWKLGQPLYSGLAKVAYFICYSQTNCWFSISIYWAYICTYIHVYKLHIINKYIYIYIYIYLTACIYICILYKIAPWMIAHGLLLPDNFPRDNCPLTIYPLKLPPRKIVFWMICRLQNCP